MHHLEQVRAIIHDIPKQIPSAAERHRRYVHAYDVSLVVVSPAQAGALDTQLASIAGMLYQA